MKSVYPIRFDSDVVEKIKSVNDNFSKFVRTEINLKVSPKKERAYFFTKNKGKCGYCGEELGSDFHIDHIVPVTWGGVSSEFNMTASCVSCNVSKGDACEVISSEIVSRRKVNLLGRPVLTFNDGYFFNKDIEKILIHKSADLDIFIDRFNAYARGAHDIFTSCYQNNIDPVIMVDNKKAIHLFVVVEYLVYSLGKYRYLVYEDIKDGDLFKENKTVFSKLRCTE